MTADTPLVTITEIEAAINHWRTLSPATGEEHALCTQAAALARPYALMIIHARKALAWRELAPDAQAAIQSWRNARAGPPATPAPPRQ